MDEILRILSDLFKLGLERFGLYYSTYIGFVVDNEDPEGYGRLKLRIPIVTGTKTFNYWAWQKGNFSGVGYGSQCIPKIGDMVMVEFEMGNARKPIWTYGHFGKNKDTNVKEKPEALSEVTNYWFKTPSGHLVEFDDKEGSPEIRITHKDGLKQIIKTADIFHGNDYANKQPIPLGNNNKDILTQIVNQLSAIATVLQTIGTADSVAASAVGLTYPSAMQGLASSLNTQITNINSLINQINSTRNFID